MVRWLPRFELRESTAREDTELVADAAQHGGIDLGLTAAARRWLTDAERAGPADQDHSAVLAHILHTATKEPLL